MKFKVGDKVKLVGSVLWIDRYYTNKVGIVIDISTGCGLQYTVGIDTVKIPVSEREMEKINIKGQQLLFSFME